jgi:small subunit ribosomal protein S20
VANTASAIKRVRQAARRRAINQPRRSAAKTLVGRAVATAVGGDVEQAREALLRAISALDRAAKSGVIHRNAADRRKSRLMLKVNAALGGEALVSTAKTTRTTGKAAAAKAARARIAASKAARGKGEQTAAGKARAALTRSTRGEATPPEPTATDTAQDVGSRPQKPAARAGSKGGATRSSSRTAGPKAEAAGGTGERSARDRKSTDKSG